MDFNQVIDRKNTSCIKFDFFKENNKAEDVIPLWVADMDFKAPGAVIRELEKAASFGIYGYCDIQEDYSDAVISWFARRFGFQAKKEWIVLTPGVVFALNMAIQAYTEPGDAVLIQEPVYNPFAASIRENGRVVVSSDLLYQDGHYTMDFADMEEKIKAHQIKLFLLCSPHNPVGRVWTKEELLQVNEICQRHQVIVVADEIHCDFNYPEHPHTNFATLPGAQERCVICTAPSKTFNLAGLQTSNIFIPNEKLREAFLKARAKTSYHIPNQFGLVGCRAAYAEGEEWLEELLAYLKGNRDYIVSYLQENIPEIHVADSEGTYLLWLDCSGLGLSDDEVEAFFTNEAKLWLNHGRIFGKNGGQFMRLNMASARSVIEKAMEQLHEAVCRLRDQRQ